MKIRPGHVRAAIGDFSAQRGVITTTADEGRAYYKVRPLFFFVICNYLPPNMTRRSVPLHSRSFFGFRHLAGNYLISKREMAIWPSVSFKQWESGPFWQHRLRHSKPETEAFVPTTPQLKIRDTPHHPTSRVFALEPCFGGFES